MYADGVIYTFEFGRTPGLSSSIARRTRLVICSPAARKIRGPENPPAETNTCMHVACLWAVKKWRRNSRLPSWMEFYIFLRKRHLRHSSRFLSTMMSNFNAKTSFKTFIAVLFKTDDDDVSTTSPQSHQWHTSRISNTREGHDVTILSFKTFITFLVTEWRWWRCKDVP